MIKLIFLILSIVVFLVAAFGLVVTTHVVLLPLALAFFAASFLPWRE